MWKIWEVSSELSIKEVPERAKIASLSKVLRTSKRYMVPTTKTPWLTTKKKRKRLSFGKSLEHSCAKSGLKAKIMNLKIQKIAMKQFRCVYGRFWERRQTKCYLQRFWERRGDTVSRASPLKLKSREIRKQRNINEITSKGKFEVSHIFVENNFFVSVN